MACPARLPWLRARALLAAAALAWGGAGFSPAPAADAFEEHVLPILRQHCFECHSHGAERIRGGLVLDSPAGLANGGEHGPVLVPGRPEASRLIQAVRHTDPDLAMPPRKPRLAGTDLAVLEEWVRGLDSATWAGPAKPGRARGRITDEDRQWWAFQPVKNPAPPDDPGGWSRNPIDRFIRARLAGAGLTPAPEANRAALIRRVTFDLTGLPPEPAEVDRFLSDASPDAYEALVDRLLGSPAYGERWARYWLDLVRYAESDGYRVDDYRPHVWRYRDWVVRSFNEDKGYDRFVQEQLAGDELWPGDPEASRVATAFLRHWIYEYNNRDARGQWQTILNDLTDVTGDVFLGLGLQCARCHDHKFDPILQKDYYRLQAFFAPLVPRDDLVVATAGERAAYEAALARWESATVEGRASLDELERPYRDQAAQEAISKFSEEIQELMRKPRHERTVLEHQVAELAYRQVYYEFNRLAPRIKGADKERRDALLKELAAFDPLKPAPLPPAFTVTDVGPEAPPVHLPRAKGGPPVEPGWLSVLDERPARIERPAGVKNSTGRRAALARWLTEPTHPLSARVMVNRVWQQHFGRGLVATSSDFGRLGERPSHPELLDWLAHRFVQDGWSLKSLHRRIVTSATYRQEAAVPAGQASEPTAARPQDVDPQNVLLGHFPTRRLEAEQIRDALLAATGELDRSAGGPAVDAGRPRRSVYTRVTRNVRDPLLEVFDAPENFTSTAQRNVTTTPTQALLMLNSPHLLQRARALARRLAREAATEPERVERAYRLVFGRNPTPEESLGAQEFLREQEKRVPGKPPRAAPFVADKMPYREGRAAVLQPRSSQERLVVPRLPALDEPEFTFEAFVLLRSTGGSPGLRAIAQRGDSVHPAWTLGVTGTNGPLRPQTLVLEYRRPDAARETVSSGLTLDLNKPYFVAVAVRWSEESEAGVTFHVKDVSNDCEPVQVVGARHRGGPVRPATGELVLGGTSAQAWDGLVDDVRLTAACLPASALQVATDAMPARCLGWWRLDPGPEAFRDASPAGHHLAEPALPAGDALDTRTQALADLCHVLLNSNEFLYTD